MSSEITDCGGGLHDRLLRRKLKYFLRLNYPMQVWFEDCGFSGRYPDLPGCELRCDDLDELKAGLEQARRAFLTAEIARGKTPPMPNSYVDRCD